MARRLAVVDTFLEMGRASRLSTSDEAENSITWLTRDNMPDLAA
jgi:hypothetical protein